MKQIELSKWFLDTPIEEIERIVSYIKYRINWHKCRRKSHERQRISLLLSPLDAETLYKSMKIVLQLRGD